MVETNICNEFDYAVSKDYADTANTSVINNCGIHLYTNTEAIFTPLLHPCPSDSP